VSGGFGCCGAFGFFLSFFDKGRYPDELLSLWLHTVVLEEETAREVG
jgi:hypothetical protein